VAALAAGSAATEQRMGDLRADLQALAAQLARTDKAAAVAALEAGRAQLTALQRGQVRGLRGLRYLHPQRPHVSANGLVYLIRSINVVGETLNQQH
jgi:hypothetical protein